MSITGDSNVMLYESIGFDAPPIPVGSIGGDSKDLLSLHVSE